MLAEFILSGERSNLFGIVDRLIATLYGGMTDDELAEIQAMSIEQRTYVEELRNKLK
jgi:hypothetical protein